MECTRCLLCVLVRVSHAKGRLINKVKPRQAVPHKPVSVLGSEALRVPFARGVVAKPSALRV